MHLFADERRKGTIELLMTYPLRDWEVVFGKYLASLVILAIMVLCTLDFPIFLTMFGKPDPGPMLTGYLGFILLAASFLAIGVLGSSLSKSQMLAFMISLGIIFGLMVLGLAGAGIGGGRISNALQYLDGVHHFRNMAAGMLDSRDILYFASLIVFCLFTAVRVVEIKRWK
jgi:ABC-2 type transport system permease protein